MSVPQLWLKMRHYEGGEEGAKGLVTSFFHLLDLEGERDKMKQGGRRELSCPSQCFSQSLRRPLSHTHLCPQIPPSLPHCSPSSRDSERHAAQRLCLEASATRAKGSGSALAPVASTQPTLWKHGRGSSGSGSRWSCERK